MTLNTYTKCRNVKFYGAGSSVSKLVYHFADKTNKRNASLGKIFSGLVRSNFLKFNKMV